MIRAYMRVSTDYQDTDMQRQAILNYIGHSSNLPNQQIEFYEEHVSGAKQDRPVLNQLIKSLHPRDVVIVYKLDRFSRSLSQLINLLEDLHNKEVAFISINESLDLMTPNGKL